MRVGRRLPLTIAIGFPCLRWVSGRNENGQNCEYFRNEKLYRCETNTFFFLKREREREICSFLTSRPRCYDEFLLIIYFAIFRATIFSFRSCVFLY